MIRHCFIRHCFGVLATGAVLAFAVAGDAAAGCCPAPAADCGCGPVVALVPVVPVPVEQIYVVNQGPVFSGPGPYVRQFSEAAPAAYPYVGPVSPAIPMVCRTAAAIPAAITARTPAIPMPSRRRGMLIGRTTAPCAPIRATRADPEPPYATFLLAT